MDEYGRTPGNPMYEDPSQRRRDSVMFDRAQHEWAKKRAGKSRAEVDDRLARGVGNAMMDNYLRREGLLAGPIERPWD